MRRIIGLVLLIAMLFSFSFVVEAENEAIVSIDTTEERKVTLTGENFLPDALINIKVFKVGYTGSNNEINKDTLAEWVRYYSQVTVGVDGKFTEVFKLDSESDLGFYTVSVDGVTELQKFYYVSDKGEREITGYFNAQDADLDALLNQYKSTSLTDPVLKFDLDEYYTQNTSEVTTRLATYKPFTDIEDIEKKYATVVLISQVHTADTSTLDVLFNNYEDVLGINIDEFYENNTTEILSIFKENLKPEHDTLEEIAGLYNEAYFVRQVVTTESETAMNALIGTKLTEWGFDAEEYNSFTNPTIGRGLIGTPFTSEEGIKSAVQTAMSNPPQTGNNGNGNIIVDPGNSSSGNGGNKYTGGSTSGGAGGGPAPIVSKPVTTTPNAPQQTEEFKDISHVAWAEKAILTLAEQGVLNGKGDGVFAPDDFVLREEFAKIVVEGLNIPKKGSEKGFLDVPTDAWFKQYVDTALSVGITKGMSDEKFGAGLSVTREDLVVMLVRALDALKVNLPEKRDKATFNDAGNISEYAVDAIDRLYKAGVINGTDTNEFLPKKNCTRAEAAVMVYAVLQLR